MQEFEIKSSNSDLRLVLYERQGDYFKVRIESKYLNVTREVYAYTDAYGFADLMEYLASQISPWTATKGWKSLESEFEVKATCSNLGVVTFDIELNHLGTEEEWRVRTALQSELGQLEKIAKSARKFFGESPA